MPAPLAADPFPRRTATLMRLTPWLIELGRSVPGLVDSFLPGRALDARTREEVVLAVTEVNGCRYCAWIHGAWRDFLGGTAPASDAALAYARASAEQGRPVDPVALLDHMDGAAARAVRATVAQIEISNLVGNTVDGLLARLTRKRPLKPLEAAGEVAVIGAALPVALPLLAAAAAMRGLARVAPAVPAVEMPPAGEANLLVHLIAEVAPRALSHAAVRLLLLAAPATITVAVRAGRTAATVRIGGGRLRLENGVASDALLVVEGEVEPLLRLATGSMIDGLRGLRIEPRP
jgi:AhpD family alkylhydroperoxidase